MLKRIVFGVVWTVVIGAAVMAVAEQPYEEYFDQTYPAAAGVRVSLENINGDVSVDVWDRDEVRVEAVKKSDDAELLAKMKIEVEATQHSIDIETDLPSNRRNGVHMSVEYTLTVPRNAFTEMELVNGSLQIQGVQGGVEVDCVNGNIDARDLAGSVSVESVNGATAVFMDSSDPGDDISIESVNGSVELHLASGVGAELFAETVNGSIHNDLGIEVHKGKYIGKSLRGTVGAGSVDISLETVNGAISIYGQ